MKRKTFMPDAALKAIERGEQVETRLSSFGVKLVDDTVLVTIGMEAEMWLLLAGLLRREGSTQATAFVESIAAGFAYLAEAWEDDDPNSDTNDSPDCAN